MKQKKIGILTSGGDCPGLNAVIRGVAKPAIERYNMRVIGFKSGYQGLIDNDIRELFSKDVSGILTLGGTILGTSRKPFKELAKSPEEIQQMIDTYEKNELDALAVLGGNGTQKTANLLRKHGLNVVGLPKTIDNDLFGTDVTFGFHSAVDIATEVLDRVHTTAQSHGRVLIVELMGHKAGWLTLYAGVAGGADVVLIPELPYSLDRVIEKLEERTRSNKHFSIIAIAEGAKSDTEVKMSKKELEKHCKGFSSVGYQFAHNINSRSKFVTRVLVPGHIQRGGIPSPYDRILSTKFGTHAMQLILDKDFGKLVVLDNNVVTSKPLEEIAGKLKLVPIDHELIQSGRMLGTSFGQLKFNHK
jgi:6-phosphofructokinase 1